MSYLTESWDLSVLHFTSFHDNWREKLIFILPTRTLILNSEILKIFVWQHCTGGDRDNCSIHTHILYTYILLVEVAPIRCKLIVSQTGTEKSNGTCNCCATRFTLWEQSICNSQKIEMPPL